MEDIFPILVAVCVALLAWGGWALVSQLLKNEKGKLNQRLAGTSGSTGSVTASTSIVVASETEGLSPLLGRSRLMVALHRQLTHAYPDASLEKFLLLSAGLAFITTVMFWLFMESLPIGLVAGLAGAYLPYMFVGKAKAKRQRQLATQLPEALDFLQRILRAGHSLSTGLAMMAEELPQPLSDEFRRCYDQHSLGQPLEDCMREMARRIESTDFAFFVTAVLIQRQTGGDLSAVLGNISGMIRQRIRLQQYVKAKTAEGRFTGYILVAFPVLMFFVASGMNASYKHDLLHTDAGMMMLGAAGGLVVMGLFAIRKITTVKV